MTPKQITETDKFPVSDTTQTGMTKTDKELEQEIIRLYVEDNLSPYAISRLLDGYITHGGVRKILERNEVPLRGRSEVKIVYKLPMEKIKKQYINQKMSTYRLGKIYNVPPSVIWFRLNAMGVEMRSLAEAKEPASDEDSA